MGQPRRLKSLAEQPLQIIRKDSFYSDMAINDNVPVWGHRGSEATGAQSFNMFQGDIIVWQIVGKHSLMRREYIPATSDER